MTAVLDLDVESSHLNIVPVARNRVRKRIHGVILGQQPHINPTILGMLMRDPSGRRHGAYYDAEACFADPRDGPALAPERAPEPEVVDRHAALAQRTGGCDLPPHGLPDLVWVGGPAARHVLALVRGGERGVQGVGRRVPAVHLRDGLEAVRGAEAAVGHLGRAGTPSDAAGEVAAAVDLGGGSRGGRDSDGRVEGGGEVLHLEDVPARVGEELARLVLLDLPAALGAGVVAHRRGQVPEVSHRLLPAELVVVVADPYPRAGVVLGRFANAAVEGVVDGLAGVATLSLFHRAAAIEVDDAHLGRAKARVRSEESGSAVSGRQVPACYPHALGRDQGKGKCGSRRVIGQHLSTVLRVKVQVRRRRGCSLDWRHRHISHELAAGVISSGEPLLRQL